MAPRQAAPARGGKREGSGRKSLYPGKDKTRHATAYMTLDGWSDLGELQAALSRREGYEVTVSDAIEDAIRARKKDLTRKR